MKYTERYVEALQEFLNIQTEALRAERAKNIRLINLLNKRFEMEIKRKGE